VIAAGIPLVIATLGFTFFGEAIRDALDPKMKRGM
jgi:peptide/nickel transport system permease protein